jgi:flagellar basal-body rod modification protein FlgD
MSTDVSGTSSSSDLYAKYGVEAAKSSTSTSTTSSESTVEDTFMTLLLAELQNQNPMEPMDSSQMVTQMAQMNSLQELQKITSSLGDIDQSNQFLIASSLIGKQVAYMVGDYLQEGTVSAFSIDENVVSLLVNDSTISIDDIIGVTATEEA